tara:strand:- start:373 stop:606 length:234 start_codon:yes stop_codon:yes gene_type:complete
MITMEEQKPYLELNEKEKLVLRNELLVEYLNEGIHMEDALKADLDSFIEAENYEAAQMFKDLLEDLYEIDRLARKKI